MIQLDLFGQMPEPPPAERLMLPTVRKAPRLALVPKVPVEEPAPLLARSGLPAPHGIGAWGGRRLIYTGDAELESLCNADLHIVLLDLLVRLARSRADLEGRGHDRKKDRKRAAKVAAMVAQKAVVVAGTVKAVERALKEMRRAVPPIPVSFADVAHWLADHGQGVHRGTLYRRPEYANPILVSMGKDPRDDAGMQAVADPEYARVARLTKPELVEEIKRARSKLRAAEQELADFLATLAA